MDSGVRAQRHLLEEKSLRHFKTWVEREMANDVEMSADREDRCRVALRGLLITYTLPPMENGRPSGRPHPNSGEEQGRRGSTPDGHGKGREKSHDKGKGKGKPFKPGDWYCPDCGEHNFERRDACLNCGRPRPLDAKPREGRGPPRWGHDPRDRLSQSVPSSLRDTRSRRLDSRDRGYRGGPPPPRPSRRGDSRPRSRSRRPPWPGARRDSREPRRLRSPPVYDDRYRGGRGSDDWHRRPPFDAFMERSRSPRPTSSRRFNEPPAGRRR